MSERKVQRRSEALLSPQMVPPIYLEAYQLDGLSLGINKAGWSSVLPDVKCMRREHFLSACSTSWRSDLYGQAHPHGPLSASKPTS